MKSSFTCLFIIVIIQFSLTDLCNAQSAKTATGTLQLPPLNVKIDGDLKEWGDSLRYYNAENHINYSITNSKDTLYMAVRINDRIEQLKILHAGITLSIDPKGKKKETYSITFPVNANGASSVPDLNKDENNGQVTPQDREELMHERITTLRGIKVIGFKDIEGDMITTSNTYGFQTAINYDQNGDLVCEAAIPLSYFHADLNKNEWSFNFKINGVQRKPLKQEGEQEQGNGGRGGRGGGGFGGGGGGRGGHGGKGGANHADTGGEDHSEMAKSQDFWEKFYLAK